MSEPILMQASGTVRPLRFTRAGAIHSTQPAADWPGLPVEVLPMQDWEGEAEVGPLRGALGVMVYLQGRVELLARGRGQDQVKIASAGDVAVVSGDELTRVLRCRGQAQVAAVDLSAGWLWAALGDYRPPPPASLGGEQRRRIARSVIELLRHSRRPRPADRLEIEDASFRLVGELVDAAPGGGDGTPTTLSATACQRLQDHVRAHLDGPITHGELASVVGLPPRSFSKAFKRTFRTTPYQYVLTLRLGEAARLMRTSSRGLAEIAYELGFSSQSHFTTAFRRAFHVAPRQYARAWRTTVGQRSARPQTLC